MEKFGLQLEDSKSRLLQSGAYIARAKQKSGECIRLQTFDFLGFTFYCGRSRKGMPYIMPKTSSKKFRQKIRDIKVWLYANRDQPLKKLMGMLNLKWSYVKKKYKLRMTFFHLASILSRQVFAPALIVYSCIVFHTHQAKDIHNDYESLLYYKMSLCTQKQGGMHVYNQIF